MCNSLHNSGHYFAFFPSFTGQLASKVRPPSWDMLTIWEICNLMKDMSDLHSLQQIATAWWVQIYNTYRAPSCKLKKLVPVPGSLNITRYRCNGLHQQPKPPNCLHKQERLPCLASIAQWDKFRACSQNLTTTTYLIDYFVSQLISNKHTLKISLVASDLVVHEQNQKTYNRESFWRGMHAPAWDG